jgi:hypothetical protein
MTQAVPRLSPARSWHWQGSIVRCLLALTREHRQFEPQSIPDPPTSCRGDTPGLANHGSRAVPHAAGDPHQRVGKAWGMTSRGGEDLYLNQEEGQVLPMRSEVGPPPDSLRGPPGRHLWFDWDFPARRREGHQAARSVSPGAYLVSDGWFWPPRSHQAAWGTSVPCPLRPSALAAASRSPTPTIHPSILNHGGRGTKPVPQETRVSGSERDGLGCPSKTMILIEPWSRP